MAGTAVAGLNGFAPPLTSFVGRAGQVGEVAALLGEYRLVTVTGPGGVGKTRLAGEVARWVAGRFADGVWLVELAAVQEPALVPAAVAVALGLRQPPGMSIVESLAAVLARQQLLVVLDNCEHVAEAVARLCGALLPAADDVRILATSREPVGIAGEARYRVPPLTLPGLAGPAGPAGSEAVALFADRARQADPHFVLGGETGPVVLHLVDCSLLAPPRTGPDGRARYLMLETLRAYGLDRLAEAGEQPAGAAAQARHAPQVAEQAAAGLQTSAGELAAARWLDGEDAALQQALAWALEHDPPIALRLAIALAPWWRLRGRLAAGYGLLRRATGHAPQGGTAWCTGQFWLGHLAHRTSDSASALGHFTAVRDALATGAPSRELVDGLAGRSAALRNLGRLPEAAEDARRALTLARELDYPAGEALALVDLSFAAGYASDYESALAWAQQAQRIDPAGIPGWAVRRCVAAVGLALLETGDAATARRSCVDGLARARDAGDLQDQADFLWGMALLDLQTARIPEAAAHLREAIRLATQAGDRLRLIDCLDSCGHLCAATQRWAEAVTLWAAHPPYEQDASAPDLPQEVHRRQKAAQVLGPARTQAAEERGGAMTLETAAEFAVMLTATDPPAPQPPACLAQLSAREQELVTLVAQGRTDTQIAAQLYISVRTVRSHLDRIRDKSGCRRRADLTRLALQAGLV